MRRVLHALCAVLAMFASLHFNHEGKANAATAPEIIALGDSYTAGNGALDYYGPEDCYRSRNSYGEVLASRLGESFGNLACSGATVADARSQVAANSLEGAETVLLTIGGNDAGFKQLIVNCFVPAANEGADCEQLVNQAFELVPAIKARTRALLRDIQAAAPQAKVALVGYPYLVDDCGWTVRYGSGREYPAGDQVRQLGVLADAMQRQLVRELNEEHPGTFLHVSLLALFAGHEVCGDGESYIRGNADTAIPAEWWHPNREGHAAIAAHLAGRADELVRGGPVEPDGGSGGGSEPTGPDLTPTSPPSAPSGTRGYAELPLECEADVPYASTYDRIVYGGQVVEHGHAIDLPAPAGTGVAAPRDGVVRFLSGTGYGYYLELTDEQGVTHRLAHLQEAGRELQLDGQRVRQGARLALVGSSGWTTGPHLHYEQWRNGQMVAVELDEPLEWAPPYNANTGQRITTHRVRSDNCGPKAIPPGLYEFRADVNGDGGEELVHVTSTRVNTWQYRGEGSYRVYDFKAWPSYLYMGGKWLSGDVNGDGDDEIIHIQSTRVCTWDGRPEGAYRVHCWQPWTNYNYGGRWLVADVDGNGRDQLVHVARGDVFTWDDRWAREPGAYRVYRFNPWPAYEYLVGEWFAADTDGNGRSELVHVTSQRVNTWESREPGKYRVYDFKPWPAYVYETGHWLVGNVTASAGAELIHVTPERVNTWESRGEGTYRVYDFKPWRTYPYEEGRWLVVDVDGNGRDELFHDTGVRINTWEDRGEGSYRVYAFWPWNSYPYPNGLWRVADVNGDGAAEPIHVVGDRLYTWENRWGRERGEYRVYSFQPWASYPYFDNHFLG